MNKKNLIILSVLVLVFILIRSINYIYHLNWSGDQASFAIEALKIYRTKTLTLIGPQISANLQGRYIFQGPIIFYMTLFFLLLGKFDPVNSSYFFMLFCALMIFPLFFGVKKLINEKAAWLMVIVYAFVPYYINYSRFIWNSTFLLSLLPILIYLMGLYKEKKSRFVCFLVAFWLGLLLQFHYQFILIIFCVFLYYFLFKKEKLLNSLFFILGLFVGFSPLILFELKHDFYNIRTMILFAQNWSQVDRPGNITIPHYYLSLSFMALITILGIFAKQIKKITNFWLFIFGIFLFFYSLLIYTKKPVHAFWAYTSPWNYLAEKKIYDIIRQTKLSKDFNIANLAYYDTRSIVIKYFMKRDGYAINYDDYYGNKYLFVISQGNKYLFNPSYEIATFKPHKILRQWQINSRYNMLLLERK